MAKKISSDIIADFSQQLESHLIYQAVSTISDLRCFMQHHVYCVWDFMTLIKYLQSEVAPAEYPWVPRGEGDIRRFINELVLEEESDAGLEPGEYISHFELYCQAMNEIGADVSAVQLFVQTVKNKGIDTALKLSCVPNPSREFTSKTFQIIKDNKAHQVAAALALGREHIIPGMFRAILKKIGVTEKDAPVFHYYLNRHVHLDEDFHAPLSLRLLDSMCENDDSKIQQAIATARDAVVARIKFWDGVYAALTD